MAKWGEGDPRWIVEERPDATNVNNWHWSEKNASQWSKDKLKELLVDLAISDEKVGKVEIFEMTSMEGEAVANNRKAKLIFFYEWNIKLKWRGLAVGSSGEEIEGTIEIPNLSEENDADEIDVVVALKKEAGGDFEQKLKDLVRTTGAEQIRKQLSKYIALLKTDFAKDLIKPTKEAANNSIPSVNVSKETCKQVVNSNASKPAAPKPAVGVQIECKTLNLKEELKCRQEEIFRTFTEVALVSAFSRGQATVDAQPQGKFSMFDGNVTGSFVSLEPNEIKQKWRFRSWPEGHFSEVTISFTEKGDHTKINISQTGIPESDFERTENGWRQFYLHSIKQTFGFGSMLY